MTFFQLVVLALIQGLTEFLPISSSGHLILLPRLADWPDQGLALDVAVHVGTLGAVVLYFRADVAQAACGVLNLLRGNRQAASSRLALMLGVATIPVVVAGAVMKLTGLSEALRSIAVIGWTMLGFGVLLWWLDKRCPQSRAAEDWTLKHAWILGLWQVLALVPGTSRAGITITGARALGYRREDSARLAMLMSIPTIIASGVFLGVESLAEMSAAQWLECALAATLAFGAALLALKVMMSLLHRVRFTPYVIYRVALGVGLLIIAYG